MPRTDAFDAQFCGLLAQFKIAENKKVHLKH